MLGSLEQLIVREQRIELKSQRVIVVAVEAIAVPASYVGTVQYYTTEPLDKKPPTS